MKVFFDTNAYVAEALQGAAATKAIAVTQDARWRIYVNQHVLNELQRVLAEQLSLEPRFVELARERCRRRSQTVQPTASRHTVPGDADDMPILGAAIAAGVDYLVTNDAHLLALHPYESLRIVTMADYIRLLENEGLL